jgi:asparagine synthase (glutamine-hydrolysing)
MCGITGYLTFDNLTEAHEAVLNRMSGQLAPRGPDSHGWWADAETGVGFGHRRLAIVDLSSAGHQPMHSASGRFVTTFNGEIYNFGALRQELEGTGCRFRGHSDTEVMLAAFEAYGVPAAVKRMVGMFAFGLWDRQERALYLCRDRMGEKPLYYGWAGRSFVFGSTLKALQAHPSWQGELDRDALALFLRHDYIPAPYSIYQGIRKLPPGTLLKLGYAEAEQRRTPEPQTYWSAKEAVERGVANPWQGSEAEAIDQLDQLLRQSVAGQMIADVPLGAFLSGGVDSSTIVALMQAQSTQPVKTFTIGFDEPGYNEAEFAKAVAQHLGTEHTELYLHPAEALELIPSLPEMYDEPFADSSQVPTYLVAKLARQHVTVSLSGDAGDELFCGYPHYFDAVNVWERVSRMPSAVKRAAASGLGLMENVAGMAVQQGGPGVLAKLKFHVGEWEEQLAAKRPELIYRQLISRWEDPAAVVVNGREPVTALTDERQAAQVPSVIEQLMYRDAVSYLPDDILVKVDRATMAVSLEARVPLLDHRIVEFAWRVPLSMKLKEGQTKWLLRQVLYRYVPQELIERPKSGFAIPVASWLRGPLRDWAESLLDERRLREEGFLNVRRVRAKWQEVLQDAQIGWRNAADQVWTVLMFQAWLEKR